MFVFHDILAKKFCTFKVYNLHNMEFSWCTDLQFLQTVICKNGYFLKIHFSYIVATKLVSVF